MSYLIDTHQLSSLLAESPDTLILDCQSALGDRNQSKALYDAGHILGAIHVDSETELSGPIIAGKTGRHPLPSQDQWQATLQRWGVTKDRPIVIYDQNNSMFAARAWWLLMWAGIKQAKVLDGGLDAWRHSGGVISTEPATATQTSSLQIDVQNSLTIAADSLLSLSAEQALLDARALPRYQGLVEPLDSKAGHIPGAINADFSKNLDSDNRFLPPEQLAQRFQSVADKSVICYCGSGVTACHNILAMTIAGMKMATLYPGSWSEWIVDDSCPVATDIEGSPL